MVNKEHALLWVTALEDEIIERAEGFLERKFQRDDKEVVEGCPLGVLTIVAMANGVEVRTQRRADGIVRFETKKAIDFVSSSWVTGFPPSQVLDWIGTSALGWAYCMNDGGHASFAEIAAEARRRYEL